MSFLPRFDVDLLDPAHVGSGFPHALFTTLRREAPIFWHPFPAGAMETQDEGFWVLTKHADIQAANRDSSSAPASRRAWSVDSRSRRDNGRSPSSIARSSETTRNAIALGLLPLLDYPDQLERLRRDPTAMRPAVEEILRWSSPVAYFARRATCDVEIRGARIAKGQRVTFWYPSANRDEELLARTREIEVLAPPRYAALGLWNPVLVVPKEIQVRIA